MWRQQRGKRLHLRSGEGAALGGVVVGLRQVSAHGGGGVDRQVARLHPVAQHAVRHAEHVEDPLAKTVRLAPR